MQLRPRAPASAPGEGATCPAPSRSSQAPASGRPTSASSSARLRRSIRSTRCTFGRHALTSALESLLQQARCHVAALARLVSAQALRRQHWLRLFGFGSNLGINFGVAFGFGVNLGSARIRLRLRLSFVVSSAWIRAAASTPASDSLRPDQLQAAGLGQTAQSHHQPMAHLGLALRACFMNAGTK